MLIGSLVLLTGILVHYTWTAIDNLDDVTLQIQAGQIAKSMRIENGAPVLQLPESLQHAYEESGDNYLYAVIDRKGDILLASSETARRVFASLPAEQMTSPESFFRLPQPDGAGVPYYTLQREVAAFPNLRIFVAQGYLHNDVYIDSLLSELAAHIGWTLPLILAAALLIAVWTIRTSLRPVKDLSDRALMIRPETRGLRLPTSQVSDEVLPLIQAINSALDRFEKGFDVQRRLTANAAHELRTPLALLTARISELDDSPLARQLAKDIERMNRLVAQLLLVSRLEAAEAPLEPGIDLQEIGETVVSLMAPFAIAQRKSLALHSAEAPVMVRGARALLEDALRNLVENAISHTPAGSEVEVRIASDGSIAVRDHGPGVPHELRERIFERFWRGRHSNGGAGLGLAIVTETMRAHGGRVSVDGPPGGGAVFTIHLPLERLPPQPTVSSV